MNRLLNRSLLIVVALLIMTESRANCESHRVVVVSLDGLRGSILAGLQDSDLRLPNLTRIVETGATADGMLGVLPTVTYASHTSIVTGVPPNVHGVLGNYQFDPEHKFGPSESWYEYADSIRVPTLWTIAHDRGLRTASVFWPVTQGAIIDQNFPEMHHPIRGLHDRELYSALCTPGLLRRYEEAYGDMPNGPTVNDLTRTQMAAFLLKTARPDLLLVHLGELDAAEHKFGPDSEESRKTLESLDSYVGLLLQQVSNLGLKDSTDFIVVSDHGFLNVAQDLHPDAILSSMGLGGLKGRPETYRVATFGLGGSFGLIARDPKDSEAINLSIKVFTQLAHDGSWGIERLISMPELQISGGYSNSFLVVNMKPGYAADRGDVGPWLTPPNEVGNHGYAPGPVQLQAAFAAIGPDIEHLRLKRGRLVDVAPTIAYLLGIQMTHTEGENLLKSVDKP